MKSDAAILGNGSDRAMRERSRAPGEERGLGRSTDGCAFWVVYSAGWLGWVALMAIPAALEGTPVAPAVVSTAGPILLGTLVALWRRKLLQPTAPLARTVVTHLALGIAYAVATAFLSAVLVRWVVPPGQTFWNRSLPAVMAYLCVVNLVLYVVLAGYLMWTESIRHVQESQARLAREAILRTQAEAQALRAQFNPHFVLNTLHSLMALVREEPETAERAIEDVGALIRYASSLERSGQDIVPLRREIEIAERYLALERLRLADRLTVEWGIAVDPEPHQVPSFSLQSLLENAIKHGISPKAEGGTLTIRVGVEAERLVVSVHDDGCGADPRDVVEGEGRGLGLLGRRLAALCGPGASLTWDTAPDRGFTARMAIPLAMAAREPSGSAGAAGADAGRQRDAGERLT